MNKSHFNHISYICQSFEPRASLAWIKRSSNTKNSHSQVSKRTQMCNYASKNHINSFLSLLKPNTLTSLMIKDTEGIGSCNEGIKNQTQSLEVLIWKGYWEFMQMDYSAGHSEVLYNTRFKKDKVNSDIGCASCSCPNENCIKLIVLWHQEQIKKRVNLRLPIRRLNESFQNIKVISINSLHFIISKSRVKRRDKNRMKRRDEKLKHNVSLIY